jgi:hypothetical protein
VIINANTFVYLFVLVLAIRGYINLRGKFDLRCDRPRDLSIINLIIFFSAILAIPGIVQLINKPVNGFVMLVTIFLAGISIFTIVLYILPASDRKMGEI